MRTARFSDLNNFENLALVETRDHWNWEMLDSRADGIENAVLKRVAKRTTREVLKHEIDHVQRMMRAQTELARAMAHQPEHEAGEEEELAHL